MPEAPRPSGGSPAPAEHELLTRLGKYVIERKLGSGGMGTVFLAQDSDLKRTVALKVLAKDRAENPVLVRRFKAEGQAAAYLQHKNIVGVYDSGQIDGFLYIALEYVDGQDVLEIIRKRGVIPVKRSIEIIRQVAEALAHAQEKQIVHRDIKPSNLLIKNDGTVKLADLGLARSIDETLDTSITRVGTTVGTVDYMSPEQAKNSKATDIRSDIYSLGCTWYHMLTGVPPYGEGSVTNKLQAHATAPLPDPRSRNERIPEGVVAVLHRMMAKQPKDRYQSPAELLEDLLNPGIARASLDVGVLSGLSQPVQADSSGSSSGDIFDTQLPRGAAEGDSPDDETPQTAVSGAIVFDDDEDVEPQSPAPPRAEAPRRKLPPAVSPPPRGKAPPRETPQPADEPSRSGPQKSIKSRKSSGDPGTSGPLPRRMTSEERTDASSRAEVAKEKFQQRKLPPRASDQPLAAEPVRMAIDPERIRTIVLGGIVVAVLAGIAFAFSNMGGTRSEPVPPQGVSSVPGQSEAVPPPAEETASNAPGNEPATTPDLSRSPKEVADETTPLRRTAEPISGAEEFQDLNSREARAVIPNWVFAVRRPMSPDARAIVIRRPGTAGEGVPTLEDALAKLPPGRVLIEFRGDGPFIANSVVLPDRPSFEFRAAPGSNPVVVFRAPQEGSASAAFISQSPVVLRGLHLVLASRPGDRPGATLLSAPAAAMKDCTLTTLGPGDHTTLIAIEGQSRDAGCVLENCHLHSRTGTGVRLLGPSGRLLAGNSLFGFETGAAVAVEPAAGKPDSEGRDLRFLRSSILVGGTAIGLRHDGKPDPESVSILSRSTLWAAAGSSAPALSLSDWPASADALSDQATAIGVSWTAEKSLVAGFLSVAQLDPPEPSAAPLLFAGDSGWQKFWRKPATGVQIQDAPVAVPTDFASLPASAFPLAQSTLSESPGVQSAALRDAPQPLLRRLEQLSALPRLPADFLRPSTTASVVEFDLTKPAQLSAFLNDGAKCPDGATVRLRGAGIRMLPALELINRRLTLEFVQAEGAPLSIRPAGNLDASAWMTVRGGEISLRNGRFLIPESDRQKFPPVLIQAEGASLLVEHCTLHGAAADATGISSLIRWNGASGAGGLLIRDSLLVAGRQCLELRLNGATCEIVNSILVAREQPIALDGEGTAAVGQLTVASSTLGAGNSIIRASAPGAGDGPGVLLTDCVVIAAPGASQPVPILRIPSIEAARSISWWEEGVAFGAGTVAALATGDGPATAGSWTEQWGPGHVLRPLETVTAVLFENPIDDLAKSEPASFRLNPRCDAATWNSNGGPAGAGPDVGVSVVAGEAPSARPNAVPATQPPVKRPGNVF